jgi:hypothetical protein
MDKPRHPQVIQTWKVERLKQRVENRKETRLLTRATQGTRRTPASRP